MNALAHFQAWVDARERESAGPNRSPLIDGMERWIGIPVGESYCACAVSYAFHLAANEGQDGEPFPKSASSQAIMRSFKTLGLYSEDPNDAKGWKGAIGGWTDPDGAHGHIFLIKGRETDAAGNVVAFITLEANTSPDGHGDNGTGFFERRRPVDQLGWILNCADYAGGAWWP